MKRWAESLRIASVILVIGIALIGLWAFWVEPGRLTVKRVELEVPGLSAGLDGMRVAWITDLHAFPAPDHPQMLGQIADQVAKERPDLILFGGDFVHGVPRADAPGALPELTKYLKHFSAPLGCYAVLGNHELRHGRDVVRRAVEAAGCPVLTGEIRQLTFRGTKFLLLGLDDNSTSPKGENTVPEDLPNEGTLLAFAHNPRSARYLPAGRGALLLAGHTHGGQIRVPFLGPLRSLPTRKYPVPENGFRPDRDPEKEYEYCFARGLYSLRGNRIFVSSGVGGGRVDARLCCPPEIVFATLRHPGKAIHPVPVQPLFELRKKDHEIR